MKNKPGRHKSTNRFKFVPFAERIQSIDIRRSALYFIEHENDDKPEQNETHFSIALKKWQVLNSTKQYKAFKKEVSNIITIEQLVHKKDHVINTIVKHLEAADPAYIQPILEILVCIAKDLGDDFYPYFKDCFQILLKLLDTKDGDQTEWTFICLAFLFKVLRSHIKKDLSFIVNHLLPLLNDDKKTYITNFVAESFAFVVRDIAHKKQFLMLILNYINNKKIGTTGCGHLLFEIIRGVNGQFHSCAKSYFSIMFHLFSETDDSICQILFEVLTQTVTDILCSINPNSSETFWIEIIKASEDILNGDAIRNKDLALELILQLVGQAVEYQQGVFLLEQQALVDFIKSILSKTISSKLQEVCSNVIVVFIQSPRFRISQENSSSMVSDILNIKNFALLDNFVLNMIDYQQFDTVVLTKYLKYIDDLPIDIVIMRTLAKICMKKSPPVNNGIELYKWSKYPIRVSKKFHSKIHEALKESDDMKILNEPELCICILTVLPHLPSYNSDDPVPILKNISSGIVEYLKKPTTEKKSQTIRKAIFVLTTCIESYLHITALDNSGTIVDIETMINVVLPYAGDCNYVGALQLLDLYFSAYNADNLNMDILLRLNATLKNNLSSPYHKVRLLSTHIYSLFEEIPELNKTTPYKGFTNCFTVESLKPSITTYREQLIELRKIGRNTKEYEVIEDTALNTNPVRYMFGTLYFNFNLLWEPIMDIIVEYCASLQGKIWNVIDEILQTADQYVKNNPYNVDVTNTDGFATPMIEEMFSNFSSVEGMPDFANYRILIWQLLSRVPSLCESNSKSITEIFFRFIQKEYRKGDVQNYLTANLKEYENGVPSKVKVQNDKDEVKDDNDEVLDDKGEDDEEPLEEIADEIATSGKVVFKTLLKMIDIYTKFNKPKKCHRSTELYNLYLDLLKHKNETLQTNALLCILTYKNEHIVPYKRDLLDLVNEKKFKDTLVLFPICKDSDVIKNHDREAILPVVLRILYGKMLSNTDKKSGQSRRSFVMRHISGCSESEIETFTIMAFNVFQKYMTLDPKTIFETIKTSTNLESVVSPNVLRSSIHFAEGMRQHLGGHMGSALPLLYKVVYSISSITHAVLSKQDELHSGFVKILKTIRISCITLTRKLFDQFDKYVWTKDDLYAVFGTMIWPSLPKLHIEGIHRPTALLQLFVTWSQNPKYYILFATHHTDDVELSPLPFIYRLLSASQTHATVVNSILEITENLLTLRETEEDLATPLQSFAVLPGASVYESSESVNYGSRLLLPHVRTILEVLKLRVAKCAKRKIIPKRDVLILSRLTELVEDPTLCEDLLSLLLPILVKKICQKADEQNIEYAITTISNLISKSTDACRYIKTIAPLFNKVSFPSIRKQLCELLTTIATKSNSEINLATIMSGLNEYSKKWIDQPDFDARFLAYDKILQNFESDEVTLNYAITIVNNIFFSLRYEKDISLRHSAAHCLRKVLPIWLHRYKNKEGGSLLVRDTVLHLIACGIKDGKNEMLKTECIALLGDLARSCSDIDIVLADLSRLTNDADREVDFFENISHLQMHRQVRALLKFCSVAKTLQKAPSTRTLTQFILPLATFYLYSDEYADKNSLVDAAIDVIAVSSRLLPWYHYEAILKHYLNKLKNSTSHQKQLSRIIIQVLESFHFDLKNVQLPTKSDEKTLTNVEQLPALIVKDQESPMEESVAEDISDEVQESDDDNLESELMEAEENVEAQENKEVPTNSDPPAYSKTSKPSEIVSRRIVHYVTHVLIPHFNRIITRKSEDVTEDINIRTPLTLGIVKILHEMPGTIFKQRFPSIIANTCAFLKSQQQQVRDTTRSTIIHIMLHVGPEYLHMVLDQLKAMLTRGFQVHVLVSTVNKLLEAFVPVFKKGDVDVILPTVMELCMNDLFGALSEEKQVDKIGHKTAEAKLNNKTIKTLNIVAQRVGEENLSKVILPIKNILLKSNSKKVVIRVQQALQAIANGFANNAFVSIEKLYNVLYGIAVRDLPELELTVINAAEHKKPVSKYLEVKTDNFIIERAPKRIREAQMRNVKNSTEVNYHILQEFSFNLFHVLIKREKFPKNLEAIPLFDVFVAAMAEAIKGSKISLATGALKGLTSLWALKISTPYLRENIKAITDQIFDKLHKNATFGMTKRNDNFHYVKNLFKAATALIRHVKYYKISEDQLKTLLLYAEHDVESGDKQVTAFNVLKAILDAKLVSPELHNTMFLIAKIAIRSESYRICEEARTSFLNYLMNYELGKKTEKHLNFFVSQLDYESESGRVSAIRFLTLVVKKFPLAKLAVHSGFLFASLGTRLVNEPAPHVQALVAECAETLIARLDTQNRHKLFELIITLFNDKKISHIEMAAHLTSRYIIVEKEGFINRLPKVLSIMCSKLISLSGDEQVGRFVKAPQRISAPRIDKFVEKTDDSDMKSIDSDEEMDEDDERDKDHCIIQLLIALENLIEKCPSFLKSRIHREDVDVLGHNCQLLLEHEHVWVRTKAVKLIAAILETVSIEEMKSATDGDTERGFVYCHPENALKSVMHDLCAQMSTDVTEAMAEQVTSAILNIFLIIIQIPTFDDVDNNIVWIMEKMRHLMNIEVQHAPYKTTIRSNIFKMMTKILSVLDTESVDIVVNAFIVALVREISSTEDNLSQLRKLGNNVGKKIRRKLGDVEYYKKVAFAETKLNIKRAERRKVIIQDKVNNPLKAAKRKLRLKERKKDTKKRKVDVLRGRPTKAKKRNHTAVESDDGF